MFSLFQRFIAARFHSDSRRDEGLDDKKRRTTTKENIQKEREKKSAFVSFALWWPKGENIEGRIKKKSVKGQKRTIEREKLTTRGLRDASRKRLKRKREAGRGRGKEEIEEEERKKGKKEKESRMSERAVL